MREDLTTPGQVEALPLDQRAAAYLAAQEALEARSQLPVS